MKILAKIILILIVFLLSSPILLLQSCGDNAPFGSSITLQSTTDVTTDLTNALKWQNFRVSVSGSDGLPMNGISVQISGAKAGTNYGFNALPTTGVTSFTITTNDDGYNNFSLVGPLTINRQLSTPTNVALSVTTSTAINNLPGGEYCYQVTAIGAGGVGETLPTTEACITVSVTGTDTGTVTISWNAPSGAANGYKVYGRTSNGESLMNAAVASTTYTDDYVTDTPDGSNYTSTLITNSTPTTLLPNTFSDTLTAITGSVITNLSISW